MYFCLSMSSQSPNNSYIKGNILRCALGMGTLWYLPCMVVFQVLLKRSDLVQSDLVQPDLRNAFSLPQHRKFLEHLEATIFSCVILFHIFSIHEHVWNMHTYACCMTMNDINTSKVSWFLTVRLVLLESFWDPFDLWCLTAVICFFSL